MHGDRKVLINAKPVYCLDSYSQWSSLSLCLSPAFHILKKKKVFTVKLHFCVIIHNLGKVNSLVYVWIKSIWILNYTITHWTVTAKKPKESIQLWIEAGYVFVIQLQSEMTISHALIFLKAAASQDVWSEADASKYQGLSCSVRDHTSACSYHNLYENNRRLPPLVWKVL